MIVDIADFCMSMYRRAYVQQPETLGLMRIGTGAVTLHKCPLTSLFQPWSSESVYWSLTWLIAAIEAVAEVIVDEAIHDDLVPIKALELIPLRLVMLCQGGIQAPYIYSGGRG
jgi:hypothetical protein